MQRDQIQMELIFPGRQDVPQEQTAHSPGSDCVNSTSARPENCRSSKNTCCHNLLSQFVVTTCCHNLSKIFSWGRGPSPRSAPKGITCCVSNKHFFISIYMTSGTFEKFWKIREQGFPSIILALVCKHTEDWGLLTARLNTTVRASTCHAGAKFLGQEWWHKNAENQDLRTNFTSVSSILSRMPLDHSKCCHPDHVASVHQCNMWMSHLSHLV